MTEEKIQRYEAFINDVLREDLKKILNERQKLCDQLTEYAQLKTIIERFQEEDLCKGNFKTQVDLGCNFYAKAVVPDTKFIYVEVGFGFFVQFTLAEAIEFIDKKVKFLENILHTNTEKSAEIKANIKLVLEGLRELQNIDPNPDPPPRQDVW